MCLKRERERRRGTSLRSRGHGCGRADGREAGGRDMLRVAAVADVDKKTPFCD